MNKKYLVIDVGGTEIKYAIMDENLNFYKKDKIKTPYDGLDKYINTLEEIYNSVEEKVDGIALSTPGIIDSDKGIAITGGALTFVENLHLVDILQERLNTKVTLENDGKCAALAEAWQGSLQGCKDGIVLVFGTAIGGGIIKDGKVHKGKHFSAGEFSFILAGDDYEQLTNSWGLRNGNKFLLNMVSCAKKIPIEELDGIKVFEMANSGDELVLKALDRFTKEIARNIFNLQAIYDPEKIAIGGGISKQELLIKKIKENLEYIYEVYPMKIPHAEVVRCEYFGDANLIGALKNFLSNK